MRCAVDFDESKPLYDQEVRAWGELQILTEEPEYKESDIKSKSERDFFDGYKYAFDDVVNILENLVDVEDISEEVSEQIQDWMSGKLCEMLFSILDNEED